MEFNVNGVGLLDSVPAFAIVAMIISIFIHILFAVVVYFDGKENGTKLVWPSIWALVVLFGGPVAAAAYWVVCRLATNQPNTIDSVALASELEQRIAARRAKIAQKRQQSRAGGV